MASKAEKSIKVTQEESVVQVNVKNGEKLVLNGADTGKRIELETEPKNESLPIGTSAIVAALTGKTVLIGGKRIGKRIG